MVFTGNMGTLLNFRQTMDWKSELRRASICSGNKDKPWPKMSKAQKRRALMDFGMLCGRFKWLNEFEKRCKSMEEDPKNLKKKLLSRLLLRLNTNVKNDLKVLRNLKYDSMLYANQMRNYIQIFKIIMDDAKESVVQELLPVVARILVSFVDICLWSSLKEEFSETEFTLCETLYLYVKKVLRDSRELVIETFLTTKNVQCYFKEPKHTVSNEIIQMITFDKNYYDRDDKVFIKYLAAAKLFLTRNKNVGFNIEDAIHKVARKFKHIPRGFKDQVLLYQGTIVTEDNPTFFECMTYVEWKTVITCCRSRLLGCSNFIRSHLNDDNDEPIYMRNYLTHCVPKVDNQVAAPSLNNRSEYSPADSSEAENECPEGEKDSNCTEEPHISLELTSIDSVLDTASSGEGEEAQKEKDSEPSSSKQSLMRDFCEKEKMFRSTGFKLSPTATADSDKANAEAKIPSSTVEKSNKEEETGKSAGGQTKRTSSVPSKKSRVMNKSVDTNAPDASLAQVPVSSVGTEDAVKGVKSMADLKEANKSVEINNPTTNTVKDDSEGHRRMSIPRADRKQAEESQGRRVAEREMRSIGKAVVKRDGSSSTRSLSTSSAISKKPNSMTDLKGTKEPVEIKKFTTNTVKENPQNQPRRMSARLQEHGKLSDALPGRSERSKVAVNRSSSMMKSVVNKKRNPSAKNGLSVSITSVNGIGNNKSKPGSNVTKKTVRKQNPSTVGLVEDSNKEQRSRLSTRSQTKESLVASLEERDQKNKKVPSKVSNSKAVATKNSSFNKGLASKANSIKGSGNFKTDLQVTIKNVENKKFAKMAVEEDPPKEQLTRSGRARSEPKWLSDYQTNKVGANGSSTIGKDTVKKSDDSYSTKNLNSKVKNEKPTPRVSVRGQKPEQRKPESVRRSSARLSKTTTENMEIAKVCTSAAKLPARGKKRGSENGEGDACGIQKRLRSQST